MYTIFIYNIIFYNTQMAERWCGLLPYIMKNKIIKFLSIFIVAIVLFAYMPLQTSFAATRYESVCDGAKDILGFHVFELQQIENCDTVEIDFSMPKDIVEFSTSNKVTCNNKSYSAGTHKMASTKKITLTYAAKKTQALSDAISVVVFVKGIENTSCALEIRYCKDDAIVEKINMTLVAFFPEGVAEQIKSDKVFSSGSLIQEDVVVSRPNEPIQSITTTIPKATSATTTSTSAKTTSTQTTTQPHITTTITTQSLSTSATIIAETSPTAPNCKHESTTLKNYREATKTENGYSGDKVCNACNTVVQSGMVIERLFPNSNGISLPIVDTQSSDLSHASNVGDTKSLLIKIFDLIHSTKQEHFIIAIGIVLLLFVICLVLIAVCARKGQNTKKQKKEKHYHQPAKEEKAEIAEAPAEQPQEDTTKTVEEDTEPPAEEPIETEEYEETMPEIGIVIDGDGLDNEITEKEEPVFNETIEAEETPVITEEPEEILPEIPLFDEYNAIMMTTLPAAEIEKILYDFNDIEDDEDIDEYKDIVSE